MTFTRGTKAQEAAAAVEASASTFRKRRNADIIRCLHSGATTLNMACSDNPFGGFAEGTMVNIIGDSSAGKTMLGLTCLAEAAHNKDFDEHELIIDDVEAALMIDMQYMFGKRAASRIQHWTKENGKRSNTIYDFYANVARLIDKGRPFVYLLDSMDAITTTEDEERIEQLLKDPEKVKGSYSMQKPKMLSEILRNICSGLEETRSILLIISQTRDKIDAFGYGPKKTRSGGHALKFYAHHEIWLAVKETLKNVKYDRIIGAQVVAKVSKNKVTGKSREVVFPIYYDYGVDDIGSCVSFMVKNKGWKSTGKGIYACPYFPNQHVSERMIVKGVEEHDLLNELREDCGKLWDEIEEAVRLERRPRFKD